MRERHPPCVHLVCGETAFTYVQSALAPIFGNVRIPFEGRGCGEHHVVFMYTYTLFTRACAIVNTMGSVMLPHSKAEGSTSVRNDSRERSSIWRRRRGAWQRTRARSVECDSFQRRVQRHPTRRCASARSAPSRRRMAPVPRHRRARVPAHSLVVASACAPRTSSVCAPSDSLG